MSRRTRTLRQLIANALSALALFILPASAQAQLFTPASTPPVPNPDHLRAQLVTIDPSQLPSAASLAAGPVSITLNLFDDLNLPLTIDRRVLGSGGAVSWSGRIRNETLSTCTLTLVGGQFCASIYGPDSRSGAFGVAPTGQTDAADRPIAEVFELAPGALVRCAHNAANPPIWQGDLRARREAGLPANAPTPDHQPLESPQGPPPIEPSGACGCGDDQSVIDLLVVYSTLAKNAAGGTAALRARVENAIQSANTCFITSGITAAGETAPLPAAANRLEVRLAGFVEVTYDEQAPEWLNHLDRVTSSTDGILDEVHALRNTYHADTVSLIVDDPRFTGGAAFYAVYVQASAFSVLNWRAEGAGSLTFAHELGHTFGCAHDRGNSSFGLFTYGWGYSFAANGTTYGTVMSYTGANLVPSYSNPTHLHSSGQPLGAALASAFPTHNALVISQTRSTIASFRDSSRILDWDGNGIDDALDLAAGRLHDTNNNCRVDEAEYRIYVDGNNPGNIDGFSWNTAYRDLGEAMAFASLKCSNVSEIWVADGVYRPDRESADRYARFGLRSGLALYGGFQGKSRPGGGETALSQRLGDSVVSILSGDIGNPGNLDNSFNVVFAERTDASAVLDGFTIQRGSNNFLGSGIYITSANPTIRRCTFRDNFSSAVGVIGAESFPVFSNCRFEDNAATNNIGGHATIRDGGFATFNNSTFTRGTAQWGGAIAVTNQAALVLNQCTVSGNAALESSGAIDCTTTSSLFLTNCSFETSSARRGGAITLFGNCAAEITGCTFNANIATDSVGGAIWVQDSDLVLEGTSITNCTSNEYGGAIAAYGASRVSLTSARIEGNSSNAGGGIGAANVTLDIDRSVFLGNSATMFSGGGIELFQATATITSSAIGGCDALDVGGGIYVGFESSLHLLNSTLSANTAANLGGGIAMFATNVNIANSILHGNSSGAPGAQSTQDQQLTVFTGAVFANRSCIAGLTGSLGGTGNFASNPALLDPASGDFRISPSSPCIDRGSNALAPAAATLDLLGNPRFADDPNTPDIGPGTAPIIDVGAVEFTPPPTPACPADFNADGSLDPDDLADYIGAYFTQPPDQHADFNADGNVDPDDLADYIGAYFSGC